MLRRFLLVFTDKELRQKLFYVILLLIAARFLVYIPIPILRTQDITPLIDSDAVFNLLNTISGGGYGKLSFAMLGVGPYITASITMQLLGVINPKINDMQKNEGELGRAKINLWTRIITVPLAGIQAWAILQFLSIGNAAGLSGSIELPEVLKSPEITWTSTYYWSIVILSMIAGSVIMMWIGEVISEFKMGEGVSLLVVSGVVSRLPNQLIKFWQAVQPNFQLLFERFEFNKLFNLGVWRALLWENVTWIPVRTFVGFFLIFLVILVFTVFINDAVRNLLVVYSKRGHIQGKSRTLDMVKSNLPVKVNVAGVLPIIFAVSTLLFTVTFFRFFLTSNLPASRRIAQSVENYLSVKINTEVQIPKNLPEKQFAGFYFTNNAQEAISADLFDPTVGQDLFGFTLSNNPDVRNSFLQGTPLNNFLNFPGMNLKFLPPFVVIWNGVLAYTFFYFVLIIFYTYFYTSVVAFKTDDIAKELQEEGAYIPGYRPGTETQDYLNYVSNRLNVAGSIFLAMIAILPYMLGQEFQFGDGTLSSIVGGTTSLIIVSVSIETLKQIDAQATAVDYDMFTKRD